MGYKLTRAGQQGSLVKANEVAVGELVDDGGEVLLGTFDGLVSLSAPNRTWSWRGMFCHNGPDFWVRRLAPGESVTLTVDPDRYQVT
jgi:hypothetical protein